MDSQFTPAKVTAAPSAQHQHPTGVAVRPAQLVDAIALHHVAAASFPLACPPGSSPKSVAKFIAANLSANAFLKYLVDPARTILLAEAEGNAIGYSMLVAMAPSDEDVIAALSAPPSVELSKFYVLSAGHGRGIAAMLMTATLNDAVQRGAASIWLGVSQQNPRANRFYEKSGFVTVGTRRFQLGDAWEDDFVKERLLSA